VSVAATVTPELDFPLGLMRRTIKVNSGCGVRNAECATTEPPDSEFHGHYSVFVVATGRATLALTSLLALPVAMAEVKPAEREMEVVVCTVNPQAVTGQLVFFSLRDGAIVQTSAEKLQIPTADIIRIKKHPGTAPDPPKAGDGDPWTMTLTWGDEMRGRVLGAHGETVILETVDLGEVPIPLEAIARFASARVGAAAATPLGVDASGSLHRESLHWLDRGSAESRRAGMSRSAGNTNAHERWGDESVRKASETDDDRVLLTNGDLLRGFIRAIGGDGIAMDTGTGPTTVPFRLVLAARMAHAVPLPTPRPYLILTLRDGARLTATGLEIGPIGPIEARLRGGAAVQVDADRVVAVEVIGGRWEWLTDHSPISYEQAPMLGPGWEYLPGQSVLNAPILVAGESYERGIGVHSRSNLVFELGGDYREFVTSFGMDDDSGPLADVTVVILVDGQRRFEKAHVRRGNLVGPIRVDVSHAGRIELIVEYGDNGDIQDRFDWVEPGLIR